MAEYFQLGKHQNRIQMTLWQKLHHKFTENNNITKVVRWEIAKFHTLIRVKTKRISQTRLYFKMNTTLYSHTFRFIMNYHQALVENL